jgi:hypothetical protein
VIPVFRDRSAQPASRAYRAIPGLQARRGIPEQWAHKARRVPLVIQAFRARQAQLACREFREILALQVCRAYKVLPGQLAQLETRA